MFVHAPRKGLVRLQKKNMRGMKNNQKPMWDKLVKQVDLVKPTLLLGPIYLGVYAESECMPNFKIVQENKNLFKSTKLSRYHRTST